MPSPRPRRSRRTTSSWRHAARARHPGAAPGRHAGLDLRPGARRSPSPARTARPRPRRCSCSCSPRPGCAPSFVVGGDVTDAGTGAQWTGERAARRRGRRERRHPPRAAAVRHRCSPTSRSTTSTTTARSTPSSTASTATSSQIAGPKVLCADDPRCARPGRPPRRRHLRAARRTPTSAPSTSRRAGGSFRFDVEHHGERARARSTCRCAACTTSSTPSGWWRWRPSSVCRSRRSPRRSARFGGVARRFDIRGVDGGATFVDDYAHLPSEIAAVLAGARGSGDELAAGRSPSSSPTASTACPRSPATTPTRSSTPTSSCSPRSTRRARRRSRASPASSSSTPCCEAHPDARVVWLPRRDDMVSFLAGEVGPGDVCISMGCGDIAHAPRRGDGPPRDASAASDDARGRRRRMRRRPMSDGRRSDAIVGGPDRSASSPSATCRSGRSRPTARRSGGAARDSRARSTICVLVADGPPGLRPAGARRRPGFEHARGRRRLPGHRRVGAVAARRRPHVADGGERTSPRSAAGHGAPGGRPAAGVGRAGGGSSGRSACPGRSAARCG